MLPDVQNFLQYSKLTTAYLTRLRSRPVGLRDQRAKFRYIPLKANNAVNAENARSSTTCQLPEK